MKHKYWFCYFGFPWYNFLYQFIKFINVTLLLNGLPQIKFKFINYFLIDINECAPNGGKGPCEDTCENLNGGYKCSCSIPGYKLSKNNHTCIGICCFKICVKYL